MLRDAFVAKYLDELTGLLLLPFSVLIDFQEVKTAGGFSLELPEKTVSKAGRMMLEQQRRAKAMLGRQWDDLQTKPEPPKGGKP